ncbi:hypothetical protein [Actinocorallia sp. A-T 12471]|uniref:hypothetical protein n=1 Tax=Actinocorallia sp. A-T 12471 TaxID=3089813 RepID=UPI0029D3F274|nr:hypothetical protein [Actinocorallia sp. A-T 12471]MDX6745006.1 hypothetical protein [Actinocorallia sp. A-T 12471]
MRRAAAFTAVLVGASLVVAPVAQAAPAKWRKMAGVKTVKAGALNNVEFVSAKLGWAAGKEGDKLALWKWNGRKWSRVANDFAFAPAGLAVAGPKRAWITGVELTASHALYYNGSAWREVAFPGPGVPVDLAAAPDGTAVSVAEDPFRGGNAVHRWKNGRWTRWKVPLPKNTSLSTVEVRAKNDVWLGGTYSANKQFRSLLMHWNGKKWKRLKVGGVSNKAITQIVADGPGTAWALRGATATSLVRWTGKRVVERRLPRELGALTLTSDGLGGVWILPYSRSDAKETPYLRWHERDSLWDFASGPRRDGVPGLGDIENIPGTSRVVSVGGLDRNDKRYPIVEIYR